MKVVLLCGGLGTRLREETEYRPKPMVDIGGKPILWHIMKNYAHYGFDEFIICLGYRGDIIKRYFLDYEAMNNDFTIELGEKGKIKYHGGHSEKGFKITLVDTGVNAMTGARIKRVQKFLCNDDEFFVTYGDGLSDIDMKKLLKFHRSHGKKATLSAVRPISRYGMLSLRDEACVEGFAEKPMVDGWANAGFFVFNSSVFDYLDADDACVLEEIPMKQLAADDELVAYKHDGFFQAMDTYREYLSLNAVWETGNVPWKVYKS